MFMVHFKEEEKKKNIYAYDFFLLCIKQQKIKNKYFLNSLL